VFDPSDLDADAAFAYVEQQRRLAEEAADEDTNDSSDEDSENSTVGVDHTDLHITTTETVTKATTKTCGNSSERDESGEDSDGWEELEAELGLTGPV
jgi:hypothetical protein